MTANRNFNQIPPSGKQPTQLNIWQGIVICLICGGRNYADNMTCDPATDSYVCDFCQLDESEPIPFQVTRLVVQQ